MQHVGCVGKMSFYGYSDLQFKPCMGQYVVSLSKTLYPHCYSRLSCEMSTRWGQPHKGCLFSVMISPEEITLKDQRMFLMVLVILVNNNNLFH